MYQNIAWIVVLLGNAIPGHIYKYLEPTLLMTTVNDGSQTAGVRLKMDPPKKVPPGPFSTVENGPPGPFSTVENGPPLCKMDPPGPFFAVENGPPGPFSTVENGPPVHFQPLKMDPPVNFHSLKMDPPGQFSPVVNGPRSIFNR